MTGYILRRLLLMLPTLLLVSLVVFSLIRLIPGDIVTLMVEEYAYAPTIDALRESLGLDRPILVQYWDWLWKVLQGDFGTSLWRGDSAGGELLHRLPVTLELTILSLAISIIIAIPLGVYSATHQETWTDYLGRSVAILFLSVPIFWVATLVLVLPAIWWRWLPPMVYVPFFDDPLQNLAHVGIPAVIIGINGAAATMRLTRGMMLEVLREDYVRTARAKGLTEHVVVYGHVVRNAMIPVVSLIGVRLPQLLSGTVIMETIFGLPGLGRWIVESITFRDYPVLQAGVFFFCVLVMLTNLIVDLAYGWLNPRIRFS